MDPVGFYLDPDPAFEKKSDPDPTFEKTRILPSFYQEILSKFIFSFDIKVNEIDNLIVIFNFYIHF